MQLTLTETIRVNSIIETPDAGLLNSNLNYSY